MEIEFFKKNLIVTEIALENASKEKPPRMFQIQVTNPLMLVEPIQQNLLYVQIQRTSLEHPNCLLQYW